MRLNRFAGALLISALLVMLGPSCSTPVGTGAIFITVQLRSGLQAKCVNVTATDGTLTLTSEKMLPANGMMTLKVGAVPNGLRNPVQVQAHGFLDEACTTSSGENSVEVTAEFADPPTMVTLTLGPPEQNDGGRDGGGSDGGADGGADAGADGGADAGTDAGVDAGVDMDMDNSVLPDDCNDNDPTIHPGAPELCGDGKDNDCDSQTPSDCMAPSCANMNCGGQNTCVGGVCVGPNENCVDGVDNNGNNLVDCLDPFCTTMACNDQNLCTGGETCQVDGGCQASSFTVCTPSEPQCQMNGVCQPDSGVCTFTNISGSCMDTLACTGPGTCMNGACVQGAQVMCGAPPTCRTTGACTEPSGTCVFPPTPAGMGSCSDTNNCTVNDSCDGDGGCAGQQVTCTPPSQCHVWANTCGADGGCDFNPRTGLACDAGSGMGAATCDGTFACNLTPTSLFPYTPSNFAENQLPADGGVTLTIAADTTLNTSTPSISSGTMPPFSVITPSGGQPTLLIRLASLTVNATRTLTITGTRPVIFAVTGNATIDGTIRANNSDPALSACGNGVNGDQNTVGAGGGGFGSVGGHGGGSTATLGGGGAVNGNVSLTPIRGGCSGGTANTTTGGPGGGAIQLSAAGTLSINGVVTTPGQGGNGNAANSNNGGGGGGSGGGILLEGNTVDVTTLGRLTANGGGGGAGSDNQTAGPGTDGSETTATPAAGGADGSGANGGGAGAAGTTAAGNGIQRNTNDGSGAGGGGVGRIRINGTVQCTIAATGKVISPPASGNAAPGCPAP